MPVNVNIMLTHVTADQTRTVTTVFRRLSAPMKKPSAKFTNR